MHDRTLSPPPRAARSGRALLAALPLLVLLVSGCARKEKHEQQLPSPLSPSAARLVAEAQQALDRKMYTVGLALADSAVAAAPAAPEPYVIRGLLAFELGRMEQARHDYERALRLAPDRAGIRHNLGNVAFRQRRFREALRYYREELERHPAPRPWHALGGAYETLGRADSARWAYEQALRLDSAYAPAHAALADWHQREGEFDAALRHARAALRRLPDDVDARARVGLLLVQSGRYEEAVPLLRSVVERQPWRYGAWFNLGQALQRLGREDARETLARAEQVRAEQAVVERLEREARTSPESFTKQVELADALRRSGRLEEAMATYHRALSLRPDHLGLQNNLATLYLQLGDTTEALARYRDILRQDSTFAETWLNLGLHYARTGRRTEAEAAWQKAVTYGADNPTIQAMRNRLRRR